MGVVREISINSSSADVTNSDVELALPNTIQFTLCYHSYVCMGSTPEALQDSLQRRSMGASGALQRSGVPLAFPGALLERPGGFEAG